MTFGSISKAVKFAMFPFPGCKITKTALNILTVQYALEFEKEGFTFFTVSPGVSILYQRH